MGAGAHPVVALLTLALVACAPETAVTLKMSFDCSIDPTQIERLDLYFEPADGSPFPGITPVTRLEDDVLVRTQDIDGDGELEAVLTMFASRFVMVDGLSVRLVAGDSLEPVRMRAIAADDQARQIGQGPDREGHFLEIEFRRDQELVVDVPVTCICLGLAPCAGTCENQPSACAPGEPLPLDGRHERLCGDGFGGFDDDQDDCVDRECWDTPACEKCSQEVCSNRVDDDCDGALDCSDADCSRAPGCEDCTFEDCGKEDDDDDEHVDDEDCDGSVDCADSDCAEAERCRICENPRPEVCDDTQDNDCDGLIDCRDADSCLPIPERCDNGFDDDCDGFADCADPDCAPTCCSRFVTENCGNGLDDDCDRLTDCDDDFCLGHAEPEDTPARCTDFADNDCDGAVDCSDPDCGHLPPGEICGNGIDDDCNLASDCDDGLVCHGVRTEMFCSNGLDDDCDGRTDCFDGDCFQPEWEHCEDGRDNDCDHLWDCSDPDCADKPICTGCRPELCSNLRDDDCDGFRDCNDQDCAGACL